MHGTSSTTPKNRLIFLFRSSGVSSKPATAGADYSVDRVASSRVLPRVRQLRGTREPTPTRFALRLFSCEQRLGFLCEVDERLTADIDDHSLDFPADESP